MSYSEFIKIIVRLFPEALTPSAMEKFARLENLYRDWNSKINVISRKDIDMLYLHHVLHSLAIAVFFKKYLPETFLTMCGNTDTIDKENGKVVDGKNFVIKILDLGTGGGFPGIPLAILFPKCDFTLCDSIGKKIKVVTEIASSLGLDNVRGVNARAENLEGRFDFIVSRAVTSIENFLPWVKGKYKSGIICLKGGNVLDEISAAIRKYRIPPSDFKVFQIENWLYNTYFKGKVLVFFSS